VIRADLADPGTVIEPPLQLSRYDVMVAPCAAAGFHVTVAAPATARAWTALGAPGSPGFAVA
jgi:hypothetical protein